MTALLRAEVIKLRTTRTFLALACAALATSLLLCGLVATLTEPTRASVLVDVFQSDTSSLFILILAIVGITGEWRHRTITSSLLAAPDRTRFLAAKILSFALAGLLLSCVVSVAVTALGMAILTFRDLPTPGADEMLELYAHSALVAALLGAFGVGIGSLVRNQAAAVVGVLLLTVAVEPAVVALASDVGRFGPFGALPAAVQDVPPESVGLGGTDLLDPEVALVAMLAWIGAAFGAGAVLLGRRDLH